MFRILATTLALITVLPANAREHGQYSNIDIDIDIDKEVWACFEASMTVEERYDSPAPQWAYLSYDVDYVGHGDSPEEAADDLIDKLLTDYSVFAPDLLGVYDIDGYSLTLSEGWLDQRISVSSLSRHISGDPACVNGTHIQFEEVPHEHRK